MALELRHFQLITAVAETGSLAGASRKLHLTSSALSHQLRDAEEWLGARLFQRRHRRLLLTGAGQNFLESARLVLAEVARAEAGCRQDAPDDVLRLSTGCYTVYRWLPSVLGRWQSEHPRVELRIVLEATRQPIPALLAGELDLALTTDPPRHVRLRRTPLFEDELRLWVASDHRLAQRRYVTVEELAAEHVLTYDAPPEQLDLYTRLFWPAGIEPRRVSRVPLTEALVDLVRAGIGVTALSPWMLPERQDGLVSLRLSARGIRRRWAAVTLGSHTPSSPVGRFVHLLRESVTARGSRFDRSSVGLARPSA
jgi:LysR family transcriptional regulator, regulator for metE and metH